MKHRRSFAVELKRQIVQELLSGLSTPSMAIVHRRPPKDLIHHSDRGVQYAAHNYVETILYYGFLISMSPEKFL